MKIRKSLTKYLTIVSLAFALPNAKAQTNTQLNVTNYNVRNMSLSANGIRFIEDAEGIRTNRYNDIAGRPTIGYGHLIRSGENYTNINQETAERLLRQDVSTAENAVRINVHTNLTQPQFDALVSFTFNLGQGNLRNSTLLRRINSGDTNAPVEFGRWVYSGGRVVQGLVNRRRAERALFAGN